MNAKKKTGKAKNKKDHQIGDLVCVSAYYSKYVLGIIIKIEDITFEWLFPDNFQNMKVYTVNIFDPNDINGRNLTFYEKDLLAPDMCGKLNKLIEQNNITDAANKKKRKKKEI